METATNQTSKVAPEFGSWPVENNTAQNIDKVRVGFDNLLATIAPMIPKGNERYLSMVKTKLEEACLLTVKGVSKPGNVGSGAGHA